MRLLIQRVKHASVAIGGDVRSRIGAGLLVLLGVAAVLYGIRLVNLLRIRIRRAKKAAKKQGSAKKKSLWARLRAWIRKTLGE